MSEDTVDYILDKLGKLEMEVFYLQEMMRGEHVNVNYQLKSETAKDPTKAYEKDAAFDVYADDSVVLEFAVPTFIETNLSFEMPEYHHAFIWDRSSVGKKGLHILGGLVDNPYRGTVGVILINLNKNTPSVEIKRGDKITQILFVKLPIVHMNKKEELSETDRNDKGWGSSDQ